ncbi:hypothetical protein AGMMS50229_05190 [Campylobacterota bacterium]|nr:hypothetical protein AGMMS50229_05190 [Campylobacterota bacterium]
MVEVKRLAITLKNESLLDVAFTIKTALGLVGSSGSGKSLTLKALLSMLPKAMKLESEIASNFPLTKGKSVGFIPQNPFTALSPMSRIKDQFHAPKTVAAALLERVGLGAWALERFASELSGGQLQRVITAIALLTKPKLLLLDEPTTALDHQSKEGILALLNSIKLEGTKMLFVSHDFASVGALCDDICVLDRGRIVERGSAATLLKNPQMPETVRLAEANFASREFRS